MSYGNLSEFLTIQDQLKKISDISSEKKVLSRIFDVMEVLLYKGQDSITLSSLKIDLDKSTISFDAQADALTDPKIDYRVLEAFKKAASQVTYDYGRYVDENGKEIPTLCIVEKDDNGNYFTENGNMFAYWKKNDSGCDPSKENADEEVVKNDGSGTTDTDKMEKMEVKHLRSDEEIMSGRDGFCSFVYSNNSASQERNIFFEKLSAYRQVASGGRFMNNVGGPVEDKLGFQSGFKFSIAFENTSYPGYATEKIVDSFAAGTIPIYWGDPRIGETFNTGAFVNCHDYASLDEVVEAVKAIDRDDSLYLRMMHTPALLSGDETMKALYGKISAFFRQIMDQPAVDARRFSRDYWAVRYLDRLRTREKAYGWTPKGLAERVYKATLWKWRRSSKALWKLDRFIK